MTAQLIIPIILQLAAVAVLIAEIIIPTGGILGIITAGLFGYSLFLVFTGISPAAGMLFVVADVVLVPVVLLAGIKLLVKSPVTLKTSLSKENGYSAQHEDLAGLTGLTGKALTDLRPAGIGMIGGKRVDVVSRGEYIDKGSDFIVQSVEGNRVVVRKI
ncbi:MAG: NfeD family protein [Desulfosalsimonadaceae bacterium]|nr:NfeD family protein [Desulfosalsimonadaceae bacterium]